MAQKTTSLSLTPDDGDPFVRLLAQVRSAAEGAYEVLGEIGRSKSGNVVYLAKELESSNLVAMKLSRVAGAAAEEFNLEVVDTLDQAVPGLESKCPDCGTVLPDWEQFCLRCGADLARTGFSGDVAARAQLLEGVRSATAGEYDVVGTMDRADGAGPVFFARDLKRDKLVALRLKLDPSAPPGQPAYSIGETQVFRPMVAEFGKTQVATAMYQPPEPPPPPPPPPPRPDPAPVAAARAPEPALRRRFPIRLIGGAGAVLLLGIIGYFAFRGTDQPPPPAPVVATKPAPVPPPPPPAPAVVEPPPVEKAAPAADSGSITLGVPLPSGGRFLIDGRATRSGSVRVVAGARAVSITVPGYRTVREQVAVRAGQAVIWRPTLTRAESAPPAAPTPAAAPTCARAVARTDWAAASTLCPKEAEAGDVAAERTVAAMYDEGRGVGQDRALAVTWYGRAAARGDRESQERLGYLYREGLGVKRDERQSAGFFKQAAEGGSARGQLEYAVALDEGKGLSQNDREAATWYQKSADQGNAPAARRLARLYERGDGVGTSETEAAKWYRVAADHGDAEAQYQLGRYYRDGKGVEKSAVQALEWFKKAAAQGHRDAAEEVKKAG